MEQVSLSDAKAHFSELVTRAAQGEEIQIMRRGRLVARIAPPQAKKPEPFDWDALERDVSQMTPQAESAGEFMRRLRERGD